MSQVIAGSPVPGGRRLTVVEIHVTWAGEARQIPERYTRLKEALGFSYVLWRYFKIR